MTVLFDTFVMDGVRRTADGYLTAHAKIARSGVQIYKGSELGRPDLDKVRLYRPPEEVFSADAMRSFAHRPVTLKHPSVPVTAKNWKKYAGGSTGGDVVRDGEFMSIPLVMMDQALIDAYEKDGIKELSAGYSTDIQWRTGVTDAGEEYDAVQTAIRGNHLAVVPVARGGDQLRIGDEDNNDNNGDYTMKLVIDGVPVNVADDQSGAIIERHIEALTSKITTVTDGFEAFKKKTEEEAAAAAAAKKVSDAMVGEIAVLKKQVADAAVTPAKLDVMVKERSEVFGKAKSLVDSKYVFDGKSIEEVRKDAVFAKLGDAAKTMSDAAIEGAFAALTVGVTNDSAAQLADAAFGYRPHSAQATTDVRDTALAERDAAMANAWKSTAAA